MSEEQSEEQIEQTQVEEIDDFDTVTEFVSKRTKAMAFAKIVEASGELFEMSEHIEQTDAEMVLKDLGVIGSDVSLNEEQQRAVREAMAEPIEELVNRLDGLEGELQEVISDLEDDAERFSNETNLGQEQVETVVGRVKEVLS